MTIELVTGHAGAAHISSADDGMFNVGIVGNGKYVFATGNIFAATVQSANLVTVDTGDACFEGRHVRITSAESVAIANGSQGTKRNDIICVKYEVDGSGIESASLAVVQGTAGSSAVDPTIPSGSIISGSTTAYMPLWRIPIDGVTVGTPVSLFGSTITPLSDLAGTLDVSKIPNLPASKITSGTLTIERGGTASSGVTSTQLAANFTLYKWGKVVFAQADGATKATDTANATSYGLTIPADYRPASTVHHDITSSVSDSRFDIFTNGTITYFGGTLPANSPIYFSTVWLTA